MPVCITGMHRSGTSLVARVLNDCGVFLGSEDDLMKPNTENREGFWENVRFVELNDALLGALGGAWDHPPDLRNGWEDLPEIESLRRRAVELIAQFEPHEPWGWKDPRSSLTLSFWRRLIPDITVVVCLRHPIEVADSLAARGLWSEDRALELWLTYNRRLVETIPLRDLTVIHYETFFGAPDEGVRRLTQDLGLAPSNVQIARATFRVNDLVRHHHAAEDDGKNDRLPANVAQLYAEMCAAARLRSSPPHEDGTAQAPPTRTQRATRAASPAVPRPQGNSCVRYTELDDSPGSAHTLMMELVPEGTRVLDVGCATGYLARALKERRSCRVTGIEISPEAAERARRHCERVIIGDIETLDVEAELGADHFHTIIFGDVLEHLRDPAHTLTRVRPFLDEQGAVVASIPNIAHGSVRLALLAGEFRYRELGLLDMTHLRFFTREGVQDLFEESGYVVTTWLRRRLEVSESEIAIPNSIPDEARAAVAADPEASTYQFIVRAVPSDPVSQLHALRQVLRSAREELDALRPLQEAMEPVQEELVSVKDELTTLRRVHEALQQRLVAERAAFSSHAHELRELIKPLRDELSWRRQAMESQTEEVKWRKGVMEGLEEQLAAIQSSRLFRYSARVRKVVRHLRPRR